MKKILMSVLSLALVVFTGFAVGCSASTLDTIPVKLQVNGTTRSESTADGVTTYTFTTTEERLAEGIDIVIDADTAKAAEEDYTITVTGIDADPIVQTGRHLSIKNITKALDNVTVEVKLAEDKNTYDKDKKYFNNPVRTFKIKLVVPTAGE